eukprot:134704-Alexandrium_andersonii.AAC.1
MSASLVGSEMCIRDRAQTRLSEGPNSAIRGPKLGYLRAQTRLSGGPNSAANPAAPQARVPCELLNANTAKGDALISF